MRGIMKLITFQRRRHPLSLALSFSLSRERFVLNRVCCSVCFSCWLKPRSHAESRQCGVILHVYFMKRASTLHHCLFLLLHMPLRLVLDERERKRKRERKNQLAHCNSWRIELGQTDLREETRRRHTFKNPHCAFHSILQFYDEMKTDHNLHNIFTCNMQLQHGKRAESKSWIFLLFVVCSFRCFRLHVLPAILTRNCASW